LTDAHAHAIHRKIVDADLLEMARGRVGPPVSVIVELNLPRAEIELRPDKSGVGIRPSRVIRRDRGLDELQHEIVRDAEELLRSLSGDDPVKLPGGTSLGVRIEPAQLGAVALSPLVRRVHLSRLRPMH
jgi:hypothetical protein